MDYLSQDILNTIQWPHTFKSRIAARYDAMRDDSFTRSFVAESGTASGTAASNTIVTSVDLSGRLYNGHSIQINGVDNYTIASISTVTITTVEALADSYVAKTIAVDRVDNIQDLGMRGNVLTNGTNTDRLAYIKPQATNGINGRACFSLPGQGISLGPAANAVHGANATIFAVMQNPTDSNVDHRIFSKWDTDNIFLLDCRDDGANNTYYCGVKPTGGASFPGVTQPSYGTAALCSMLIRNGRCIFNMNGTTSEVSTGMMTGEGTTGSLVLGSSNAGTFTKIGEAIWIDGALNPYEFNHLEDFLKRKWGFYE